MAPDSREMTVGNAPGKVGVDELVRGNPRARPRKRRTCTHDEGETDDDRDPEPRRPDVRARKRVVASVSAQRGGETANDHVMEKVDAQGNVIGFSVLRVSALTKAPLEVLL